MIIWSTDLYCKFICELDGCYPVQFFQHWSYGVPTIIIRWEGNHKPNTRKTARFSPGSSVVRTEVPVPWAPQWQEGSAGRRRLATDRVVPKNACSIWHGPFIELLKGHIYIYILHTGVRKSKYVTAQARTEQWLGVWKEILVSTRQAGQD
jgi:hypothetical protein